MLGGMEYVTPFKDFNAEKLRKVIPESLLLPEDSPSNKFHGTPAMRDYYYAGNWIIGILSTIHEGSSGTRASIHEREGVWKIDSLNELASKMCCLKPSERLSISQTLEDSFFSENPLIFILEKFLKEIRTLKPNEKLAGFKYAHTFFYFLILTPTQSLKQACGLYEGSASIYSDGIHISKTFKQRFVC
jgi:hypothetical protein